MNLLLPGSMVCCGLFVGVFFPPEQIIMLFLYRKDTGLLGYVLFKPQKLFHFLLRFSHSKPSFTLMSDCLRSLWIHQSSLCCLLVLILLIFNMIFHSVSHVPVSACMENEGRSKRICLHVQRVHNIPFLGWKGRYNFMGLCIFIKIVASV